jgi:hypothetical protein
MTTQEIIKGNKLIADFMGFEYNGTDSFGNDNYRIPDVYREFFHCSHFDNLHFDRSWEWLMPVIFKINKNHNCITIKGDYIKLEVRSINRLSRTSRFNKYGEIGAAYRTVTEFMTWYNENNKK